MKTPALQVDIKDCGLFEGLSEDVLSRVRELVVEREVPAQTTIFHEGDPASELYILASGQVELTYTLPTNGNVSLPITTVRPGEVFAWSALVAGKRLTAQAETVVDSRVYALPATQLQGILVEHPAAGYEVMCRLAQTIRTRLRDTRAQLRWLQSYS